MRYVFLLPAERDAAWVGGLGALLRSDSPVVPAPVVLENVQTTLLADSSAWPEPVVPKESVAASTARALAAISDTTQQIYMEKMLRLLRNTVVHDQEDADAAEPGVDIFISSPGATMAAQAKSNGVVTADSLTRHFSSIREVIVKEWSAASETSHFGRELLAWGATEIVSSFFAAASERAQLSLFEMASRARLVDASDHHVLRQRDGALAIVPPAEDEPGEDSQIALTAPISPNAPNTCTCGFFETDGYLAA